jgi:hypothetical protein
MVVIRGTLSSIAVVAGTSLPSVDHRGNIVCNHRSVRLFESRGVSFSIIRGGTCSYLQSPSALRDMKRVGSRKQPQLYASSLSRSKVSAKHCRCRPLTTSHHALQYKYIGGSSSLHPIAYHHHIMSCHIYHIISSNQRINSALGNKPNPHFVAFPKRAS